MIIPIRCYTCNRLIGNMWENKDNTGYIDLLKQGLTKKEALDKLGLEKKICCRRMILTHIETISKINF